MSKVSKYGIFSGPHFHVFSPNTGKYGPKKTPYLDTFHAAFGVGNGSYLQTLYVYLAAYKLNETRKLLTF